MISKKARLEKIELNSLQQISVEELSPGVIPLMKPPTTISPAVSIPIYPLIKPSPAMSPVVASPVTPLAQITPSYGCKLIRHILWVKEVKKQLFHDSVKNTSNIVYTDDEAPADEESVAVLKGMENGSDTEVDERKIENMKTDSDEENVNDMSETECVELDDK